MNMDEGYRSTLFGPGSKKKVNNRRAEFLVPLFTPYFLPFYPAAIFWRNGTRFMARRAIRVNSSLLCLKVPIFTNKPQTPTQPSTSAIPPSSPTPSLRPPYLCAPSPLRPPRKTCQVLALRPTQFRHCRPTPGTSKTCPSHPTGPPPPLPHPPRRPSPHPLPDDHSPLAMPPSYPPSPTSPIPSSGPAPSPSPRLLPPWGYCRG